jgi:hypothetical protein
VIHMLRFVWKSDCHDTGPVNEHFTASQLRFKVARDSLHHELQILDHLLKMIEDRQSWDNIGTVRKTIEMFSWPVRGWSPRDTIQSCRSKIQKLDQAVETDTILETHRGALEGRRFRLLWWTGHLYT